MLTQIQRTELDAFIGLLSHDSSVRQRSSFQIVGKVANDAEKTKVRWLFKRLIRGLGSTKESSRAGFFSTLVGILNITPHSTMSFDDYSEIINKELNQVTSKLDEGLTSLGKILAYGALFTSGYADRLENDQKRTITKAILVCSQLKDYLSSPAFVFLAQLLRKLNQEEYTCILSKDVQRIFSANKASLHDKLWFCLVVEEKFGHQSVKLTIGTKKVVSEKNIETITEQLFNKPLPNHPVYRNLSEKLVENASIGALFWKTINEHCEKKKRLTPSQEGFILCMINGVINALNQESLNVVQHMIKGSILKMLLYTPSHQVNPLVKTCLNELSNKLHTAPSDFKVIILKQILEQPRGHNFDGLTGTRFLFRLTSGLDDAGIKEVAKIYYDLVVGKGNPLVQEDVTVTSHDRVQAAYVYKKLISNISVPKEKVWKINQLKKLIKLGILQGNKKKVTKDISTVLKDVFFYLVMDKYPSINNYTEVLSDSLNFIQEEMKKGAQLSNQHEGVEEALKKGLKKADELTGISLKNQSWSLPVFRLLILYVTLLVLKEPSTGIDLLNDLFEVYERLSKPTKNKDDDLEWSEVLIDMFLLLLSKNSYGNRQVVTSVFKHIYPHMGMNALQQILNILDPNSEEEDYSDEKEQDDVEEQSEEEESNEERDSGDSERSDEDSDIDYKDSDEEDPTQTEKLRMALTTALSQAGMSDNESVDIDEMTEEESSKLDEVLSDVFRSQLKRKSQPKKLSKLETNKTHFKIRVLDLIEELFSNETTTFEMIEASVLNLLNLQQYCIKNSKGHNQLLARTKSCLRKLGNLKKCEFTLNDVIIKLPAFFDTVVKKKDRVSVIYNEMFEEIIAVAKFILRISTQAYSKDIGSNEVFIHFKDVFNSYYTGEKDSVPSNKLFISALAMGWRGMYLLMPEIVQYGFLPSVNQHKQCQALELFEMFIFKSRYLQIVPEEYKENVSSSFKKFNKGVLEIMNANGDNKIINSKKFNIVLKLLQKLYKSEHKNQINWSKIKKTVVALSSSVSISNKQNFKGFTSLTQVLQIKVTLEKSEPQPKQVNNVNKEIGPKKRKQDARKLKKESKKMRLETMSGLENCIFNSNFLEMCE